MVERICPACEHGNPVTAHYCGACGAPLERLLPARRIAGQLTIAGRDLPVTWRQVGRTVALGVAAVAAEAGIAWLRR
ncbi:MAG TPA: zinc ribbon domain-containing protein, partial [Roseiflexaceae bacterium]|nr:zinc ribbon domain-containing protein [Roseiflexaceae bacterium]